MEGYCQNKDIILMVTVSRDLVPTLKRDLNFNCIIPYILINPIAVQTDKGDDLGEKNYLHEHTIDARVLLSSAFCDDPYVNRAHNNG